MSDLEKQYDEDRDLITEALHICPIHRLRDCSPLLNGCSEVIKRMGAWDRIEDMRLNALDVLTGFSRPMSDKERIELAIKALAGGEL